MPLGGVGFILRQRCTFRVRFILRISAALHLDIFDQPKKNISTPCQVTEAFL